MNLELTREQLIAILPGLDKVRQRAEDPDMPDSVCCEMICSEWLIAKSETPAAPGAPAGSAVAPREGKCDDEEFEEVQIPASRLGDLWVLGKHRLLCGDSTDAASIARLVGSEKADLVFTDPPYNVDYDPEERHCHFSKDRTANKLGKIKNDKKSPEEFRKFLDAVYGAIDANIKAGRPIYICHADTEGHHFRDAFIAQPWKLQACLIWKKTVIVFGRADYHWMHEPILYGWKAGEAHVWAGDRKQRTVIEIASEHYDKADSDTGGKYVHPTQKPVKLILVALQNSSFPGDVVLDSFGGSGSTLIACEKVDRQARLCELDPRFVDVIIKRWEKFTGGAATLEATGQTYAQVCVERLGK